jgi:hypothetical protein
MLKNEEAMNVERKNKGVCVGEEQRVEWRQGNLICK